MLLFRTILNKDNESSPNYIRKNVAMGSQEEIKIEDDFILIRFQNDSDEVVRFERQVSTGLIQFHFGLKGKAKFIFN